MLLHFNPNYLFPLPQKCANDQDPIEYLAGLRAMSLITSALDQETTYAKAHRIYRPWAKLTYYYQPELRTALLTAYAATHFNYTKKEQSFLSQFITPPLKDPTTLTSAESKFYTLAGEYTTYLTQVYLKLLVNTNYTPTPKPNTNPFTVIKEGKLPLGLKGLSKKASLLDLFGELEFLHITLPCQSINCEQIRIETDFTLNSNPSLIEHLNWLLASPTHITEPNWNVFVSKTIKASFKEIKELFLFLLNDPSFADIKLTCFAKTKEGIPIALCESPSYYYIMIPLPLQGLTATNFLSDPFSTDSKLNHFALNSYGHPFRAVAAAKSNSPREVLDIFELTDFKG